MEKLTMDQLETVQGGEDCFATAVVWETTVDIWYSDPGGFTYGMMMTAWGAHINCVSQIPIQ
jgi:hypothetical protein